MCHAEGSVDNSCDDNGKCSCNNNVVGDKCDQCADGADNFPTCDQCAAEHWIIRWIFDLPDCEACDCNEAGSSSNNCDSTSGQCPCKENIAGDKCDEPAPGYYNFPEPEGNFPKL